MDAIATDSTTRTRESWSGDVFAYDRKRGVRHLASPPVRLQEGRALLDDARDAHEQRVAEYGDQYDATQDLHEAFDAVNRTYMDHVRLARIALRDRPGLGAKVMLHGGRKESIAGWVEQARSFYNNALGSDAIQHALGRFNITAEVLSEARAQVQRVIDLNEAQEKEKGEAQEATAVRNAAVDALDDWMLAFRTVAEIALADQPQQLEKLQIHAPS